MRLHQLSIAAFGPFVDTVRVDFDELAAGGVFLLTGDTGAGKTSVLDAVCFALYGQVPGDRHCARHLRSDQAEPHAEPLVVLLVSIGERTFRFTRSPSWDRPKRRGAGTIRVQAHVVVEERRSGDWLTLTNRLDEAGQLVTDLLGMTCTQFTQVAMLPQGRFQAFLRATSTERHDVLQRLFRTRRFEEVEHWLAERRNTLGRESRACHDRTAGVVNRIQEAGDVSTPDGWDLHDLAPVLGEGSLLPWGRQLREQSVDAAASLEVEVTSASQELALHILSCDQGRQRAQARSRGEGARRSLGDLTRTALVETELSDSLEAHRRAASVLPTALRAENAAQAAVAAEIIATTHAALVAPLVGLPAADVRPSSLSRAATRASEARAVAQSWLPREAELHEERVRLRSTSAAMERLSADIARGEDERDRLGATCERLLALLGEARVSAGRADTDRLAVTAAEAGLAAARLETELAAQLDEAHARLLRATEHAQDLRDRYLDLRERRVSGMAAELAVGLAAGCSCPVCGSPDHPSPASSADRVRRTDEDAARQDHETADFERQALRESVTGLSARVEAARGGSQGLQVTEWEQTCVAASRALEHSRDAGRRAAALESESKALEKRGNDLVSSLAGARATLEARAQQHAESQERCDTLAAELQELLSAHPGTGSVTALVKAHDGVLEILEQGREALIVHERAAHELAQASAAASAAACAAGFASTSDALAAVLPSDEAAARARVLETRRATRAAASAVLADPAVAEALAAPAPDLEGLESAVQASGRSRDRAHAAHQLSVARASRLRALLHDLEREVAAWEPIRAEHDVTAALASLVEGRSSDNQLKMRLSSYVLSERLRQVVAAANDRIGAMTDQRYALEQADEKGAGEQRGGLSLRIRDEWSGKQRDPATLSGGETFLVSLSLALGLADTVTHESGGTQLDTLFIDEGFGALDAATLDGVMDTLDSLRDGGRVVGLVSHVAELRNRVPSQLEVCKARRGSTLRASVTTG